MIHMQRKPKSHRSLRSFLLYSAVLCAALMLLSNGTRTIAEEGRAEQLEILEQAVRRATIQCYAIEGRYPPDVAYLEEHYGISIDREAYHVFYDGWASNIMPEITILPAAGSEAAR